MPRRASADNLVRLTKSLIPTLVLSEGQTERVVWDTEVAGLGLRLRRSGNASWVIRPPRKGGTSRIHTLGPVTALSLTDARKAASDRMANATLGNDPHAEREAAKARAASTFGSKLPQYLARAEGRLRASSYGDVRRYLEVQCKELHALPLKMIRRAHIATCLARIAAGSKKPTPKPTPYAADRARAALSKYFAWCLGEGLVELNPVVGSNRHATEASRSRVLTDAELAAVWQAAGSSTFGQIVRLLILTGQRREEVAGMRWSELDLQGAVWRLPPERTKNKRPHDVPLSAAVLDIIASVQERDGRDLLFGTQAGPFSGFSKMKAALDRRSGVTGWRIHDLRRTCSTGMNEIGVQPHIVEAVLNHISGSRAGVAGVYNRATYRDDKRTALDQWSRHVLALCNPSVEITAPDAIELLTEP